MVQPKRRKSSSSKSTTPKKPASSPAKPQTLPSSADAENEHDALHLLHEVSDYAIIMLDIHGNVTSWNKGAEIIKGYKAKEILGKNYRIFYTSEDRAQHLSESLLKEANKHGRTTYEGWRVRKDGSRFWGSMALTALHNADGNMTGYLKLTRDLTEKKIAEDNYSNFVEELQLKNERAYKE